MTKKGKRKQAAVPYEFIQEVNKMSKDQIVKRFIQEENDLKAMKKVKREDEQLSGLALQIKDKEEANKLPRCKQRGIRRKTTDGLHATFGIRCPAF